MWIKVKEGISKRTRLVNLQNANYMFIEKLCDEVCRIICYFDDYNQILYVGTLAKCEVYIENVYLFLHDELHGTCFVQED